MCLWWQFYNRVPYVVFKSLEKQFKEQQILKQNEQFILLIYIFKMNIISLVSFVKSSLEFNILSIMIFALEVFYFNFNWEPTDPASCALWVTVSQVMEQVVH